MKGSLVSSNSDADTIQIEATVMRCGCGNPSSHPGAVCPKPKMQQIGIVAEWHRPWYNKLWRRFTRWLGEHF